MAKISNRRLAIRYPRESPYISPIINRELAWSDMNSSSINRCCLRDFVSTMGGLSASSEENDDVGEMTRQESMISRPAIVESESDHIVLLK